MKTQRFFVLSMLIMPAVFLLSFSLFAQGAPAAPTGPQAAAPAAIDSEDGSYTLGKNDLLEISVRNQPEFSGQFVVGPDGNIQCKFIGDIMAEGLTKDQLKDVLTQALQKFIKVPEVSVIIMAYRSKFVYVLGEVKSPGKYPITGDTVSLREALVTAGLPTPAAALRRAYVITPAKKRPRHKRVDIFKLLYKGLLRDDIQLASGDVVVVPSTVPSELNRALTNLLSPFSKAASSAAIYQQLAN